MRLLTRFWINTPVGKLEFNRHAGPVPFYSIWSMHATRGGVETRKLNIDNSERLTTNDVLEQFGWPKNSFNGYGSVYEDVPDEKIEPAFITLPPVASPMLALVQPGRVLWFYNMKDLETYSKQQGEK